MRTSNFVHDAAIPVKELSDLTVRPSEVHPKVLIILDPHSFTTNPTTSTSICYIHSLEVISLFYSISGTKWSSHYSKITIQIIIIPLQILICWRKCSMSENSEPSSQIYHFTQSSSASPVGKGNNVSYFIMELRPWIVGPKNNITLTVSRSSTISISDCPHNFFRVTNPNKSVEGQDVLFLQEPVLISLGKVDDSVTWGSLKISFRHFFITIGESFAIVVPERVDTEDNDSSASFIGSNHSIEKCS